MRYLLLVSYDGTNFSGWQIQPGKRTVQEAVEMAAEKALGCKVNVSASGRTDAKVHALGQVVQFDAETCIPAEKLCYCLNRFLPSDVKVLKSRSAPLGFDCTRTAKKKTYLYTAYYAETVLPLAARYAVRLTQRPKLERMHAASKLLLGEHDFAAFRSAGFTSKTSVRTIYEIKIESQLKMGVEFYQIEISGSGFLYNMVRIICGELFAIGFGKESGILQAFQTGQRSALAKTMPPEGLCLKAVDYGEPLFNFGWED